MLIHKHDIARVAWMQRSGIREIEATVARIFPDSVTLHPGYVRYVAFVDGDQLGTTEAVR